MTTIETRVEIDAENADQVFRCTTDPDVRWNGWATPCFDRGEAEKVIAMVTRDDGDEYHRFRWTTDREGRDVLLMGSSDGCDEWWWEDVGDEETGYFIGAWSWTWMILTDDAPHEPDALTEYLQLRKLRTSVYCAAHNATMTAAREVGLTNDVAYGIGKRAGEAAMERVTG